MIGGDWQSEGRKVHLPHVLHRRVPFFRATSTDPSDWLLIENQQQWLRTLSFAKGRDFYCRSEKRWASLPKSAGQVSSWNCLRQNNPPSREAFQEIFLLHFLRWFLRPFLCSLPLWRWWCPIVLCARSDWVWVIQGVLLSLIFYLSLIISWDEKESSSINLRIHTNPTRQIAHQHFSHVAYRPNQYSVWRIDLHSCGHSTFC